MNADHLSYQRATSVSVIGLVVQIVLGVTLLVYGNMLHDPVARSASFLVFYGAPVWLALILVFHQHKRERLEAVENEQFRGSGAAGASVFGDEVAAEQVQADKLASMHRFLLPAVSLILAAAYIATGLVRFAGDMEKFVLPDTYVAPPKEGAAIAIGVALLASCFILARFVAGMAKQKVWSLLHAGAAASVGAAIAGAMLLIAHGLELAFAFDKGLRYGPVIIDALMIFLGAEIVLNFVLTLYRPRKAGDYLRPAFDSRLLAFLAAPDRLAESVSDAINYQLGFDVSSTWFYRLVSRSLLGLGILGVLTLWGMTCFAVVQPDEKGLLLSGSSEPRELDSGTVIKKPWPFARVETYPASAVSSFTVGLVTTREDPSKPRLWTDDNPSGNRFMLVQSDPDADRPGDQELALLIGEVPVQFTVDNLRAYMSLAQDGPSSEPEKMRRGVLRATASSVVTRFFLEHTVEQLLGPQRGDLENELRADMQRTFDNLQTIEGVGSGVRVLFAGLQGVRPPSGAVADAFEASQAAGYRSEAEVELARAERIAELSKATGDVSLANEILATLDQLSDARRAVTSRADVDADPMVVELERRVEALMARAGGDAAIEIIEARTERWRRHLRERTRAALSGGQSAGFDAAPEIYQMRLFVDAFKDATKNVRVWISPLKIIPRIDNTEINNDLGLNPGGSSDNEGQE